MHTKNPITAPASPSQKTAPCIVLLAGEPSGDFLGARLMKSLKENLEGHEPKFYGIGGTLMQHEGITLFDDVKNQSIMGFPLNPRVLWQAHQNIKAVAKKILSLKPDVVITIDYPGFNLRVAKQLKGHDIPLIHYVAPTVWAWRPKRVEKFAAIFDHLLALFPFEAPYFEKSGLPLTFVGHPLIEKQLATGNAQRFLKKFEKELNSFFPKINWESLSPHPIHSPNKASPLFITILPGSRKSEVEKLFPIFLEAMHQIKQQYPNLCLLIPTVDAVKEMVRTISTHHNIPHIILEEFDDRLDAYSLSRCALAASGTISLELACAHLPMVIAYKVPKLTEWILKRLLTVQYVSMVNILTNQSTVPECLQNDCNPAALATQILQLIENKAAHQKQITALKKVVKMLGSAQNIPPSTLAAQTIIQTTLK